MLHTFYFLPEISKAISTVVQKKSTGEPSAKDSESPLTILRISAITFIDYNIPPEPVKSKHRKPHLAVSGV